MNERLASVIERVRDGVSRALAGERTPNEVAVSFAFAALYAALPTAGTALVVFVALAAISRRVSRVALLAALVVFNPVVKWAIYAASYPLGAALLGPAPGADAVTTGGPITAGSISWGTAEGVLARQLLGNGLLAVGLAVAGYVVVLALARRLTQQSEDAEDAAPTPDPTG